MQVQIGLEYDWLECTRPQACNPLALFLAWLCSLAADFSRRRLFLLLGPGASDLLRENLLERVGGRCEVQQTEIEQVIDSFDIVEVRFPEDLLG